MSLLEPRVPSPAQIAARRGGPHGSGGPRPRTGRALLVCGASVVSKKCLDNAAGVAPGFSPAFAALKGGATLSTQLLDTRLAQISCRAEAEAALTRRAYGEVRASLKDCFLYERSR